MSANIYKIAEVQLIISENCMCLTNTYENNVGLPFNIAQYSLIHRLISQVVGRPFGNLTFQLGDVHLYDRHIELISDFCDRKSFDAPKLWIDPTISKFEDFKFGESFKLIDYKKDIGNSGVLSSEVSVTISELERLKEDGKL